MTPEETFSIEYRKALQLIDLGRYDLAAKHLSRCLSIDPNDADALSHLALIKCNQNKYREATELIQKSISNNPENYYAYYLYSKVLYALNDDSEALIHINTSLNYYPEFVPAIFHKAAMNYNNGYYNEALDTINYALSLEPGDSDCLTFKSKCLRALGNKSEAHQLAKEGLSYDVENTESWFQKARLQVENNQYPEARISIENALRLSPESESIREYLLHIIKLSNNHVYGFEVRTNKKLLITKSGIWAFLIPHFWVGVIFSALLMQFCNYMSHVADVFYYFKPFTKNLFSVNRKRGVVFFTLTHVAILILIVFKIYFKEKATVAPVYEIILFFIFFISYITDSKSKFVIAITIIAATINLIALSLIFYLDKNGPAISLAFFNHITFTILYYVRLKILGINRTYLSD